MLWRRTIFPAVILLAGAGCGPEDAAPPAAQAPMSAPVAALPAAPPLGAALPAGTTAIGNDSLAGLFTIMAHEIEGNARRPHLVRYEAPVRVVLEGTRGAGYAPFLRGYLNELRNHAGIDIALGAGSGNLVVRFVDDDRLARVAPGAICVIAAGNVDWGRFAADPLRASAEAIAEATRIDLMTIFVPGDAPPYRVRNCLLEEIPQALGLSNDLYGLGDSSFNDDGAHIWPTKLDYLMLRLLYVPEMTTGLDRAETRARAAALLDRLNPEGRTAARLPSLRVRGLGEWSEAMARVFSRRASPRDRVKQVDKALTLVQAKAPGSPQHCHTLVTAGRVLSQPDPRRAIGLLDEAATVCNIAHGQSDVRLARIQLEKVCALLRLGRYDKVIDTAEIVWPVLAAHGQDERLAALYTIQSDALAATEPGAARTAQAATMARDWSAYAVGPGRRASNCRPRN